ncbi:MAG: hypothetical protein H0U70_06420 [Tatlockia sp.]|nr:hypothetical protein [Tatlockia sp.]
MPFVPLQQNTNPRPSEIGRINPGYLNVTLENKFVPVEGVTYIWVLNAKQELIIGIEEPWNQLKAFELNYDNETEKKSFEQLVDLLRDPTGEQVDTWKFGHPSLTSSFNSKGELEEGEAYLGGELHFNEELGWVLTNESGRYGGWNVVSEPIVLETERTFQEQVIKTCYVAIEKLNKVNVYPCLEISFLKSLYDQRVLAKKDLLRKIKNFPDYIHLGAEQLSDLEFVKILTDVHPNMINQAELDFFINYKNEAMGMLEKSSAFIFLQLLERFKADQAFSGFAREYFLKLGVSNYEIIQHASCDAKDFNNLVNCVDFKNISQYFELLESAVIRSILQFCLKMNFKLTHLDLENLAKNKSLTCSYHSIMPLFNEENQHAFAALMIHKGHPLTFKMWICSLDFEQLAKFLSKKPSAFAFILYNLNENNLTKFMHYLVKLNLDNKFKLNLLFDLHYDPSFKQKIGQGLTLTPINAALLWLNDKKLTFLLRDFGNTIIYNSTSAYNFLSLLKQSVLKDEQRDLIIKLMLGRVVEITENDYDYLKLLKLFPSSLKCSFEEAMQLKLLAQEEENSQQIALY